LFVKLKDTCEVLKSIAIIRCAPDCAELPIKQNLISLHAKLMRSEYFGHTVFVKEPVNDVHSKHIPSSSRRQGEACVARVWIGIRPHQVGERAFVRDLLDPLDLLYIRYMLNCWREACVDAEHIVFDYCGYWKIVKQICE